MLQDGLAVAKATRGIKIQTPADKVRYMIMTAVELWLNSYEA